MRRFPSIVLVVIFGIATAHAKIGDKLADYEARYGRSVKQSFDSSGSGISVYRTDKFKEIRVTFSKGLSRREVFKTTDDRPIPRSVVDAIRAENAGQKLDALSQEIDVWAPETASSTLVEFEKPSGRETTYTGSVKIRNDNDGRYAVLIDHGKVVELPLTPPGYPDEFSLMPGRTYLVTLLQEWAVDTNTRSGVVSKREHVDWNDCVDDVGSNGIEQLVRITEGGQVIFDRSICGIHHVKMELRNVEIDYGMYAAGSEAESYCMQHFPHFRDFALGGCVVGDQKFTTIYICPRCVAECNEYTRQHPKKDKTK